MPAKKLDWYARVTNKGSPHEQGLIIEEDTGKNIAVTYASEHAAVIANAVNMHSKLVTALERAMCHQMMDSQASTADETKQLMRAVLNEVRNLT